jgi:hypothetical protein
MLMNNWPSLAVAAIALTTGALKANAQSPLDVVVAAGRVHVDRREPYSQGAQAQLSVAWPTPTRAFGLRIDAFVLRMRQERDGDPILAAAQSNYAVITGVTVSATVFPLVRTASWLQPYALIGAGGYNSEDMGRAGSDVYAERHSHFLLSGGGGMHFGRRRRGFSIEARRYGVVSGTGPRLTPISLGFRF